jgi:hypothetical protein
MGEFMPRPASADIEFENARTGVKMVLRCLVDRGALHLCITQHVARQLGFDLEKADVREVMLADGTRRKVPYVGAVLVRFANRFCFAGGVSTRLCGVVGRAAAALRSGCACANFAWCELFVGVARRIEAWACCEATPGKIRFLRA